MSTLCKYCGKPQQQERAGSFTSYLFQHKFCQCNLEKAASGVKVITCAQCGKAIGERQNSGSFTGFLFKDLRCQCRTPKPVSVVSATPGKHTETSIRKRTGRFALNESLYSDPGDHAQLPPGTVIGGTFKIIASIGEGGMGVVYAVEHLTLHRQFALKVLTASLLNEQTWQRFQTEAKLLAGLSHPTLVKVYDLGIHENRLPYYSMDLARGSTLEDIIAGEGPQSLNETIRIFMPILDGLAYAHRHNIVHRDLKPANIMVSTAGGELSVKILDFGISKLLSKDIKNSTAGGLTVAGETFGSPYYMSPEQCAGEPVDYRSDIYSIGCTMFECLTAHVPFEGKTALETAMMHQQDAAPLMGDVVAASSRNADEIDEAIEYVVARCLEKRADDRYQAAKEISIDLDRIREGKVPNAMAEWMKRPQFQEFKQQSSRKNAFNDDDKQEKSSIRNVLIAFAVVSTLSVATVAYVLTMQKPAQKTAVKTDFDDPVMTAISKQAPGQQDELTRAQTRINQLRDGNTSNKVAADLRSEMQAETQVYSHMTPGNQIVFEFPAHEIGIIAAGNNYASSRPAAGNITFDSKDHLCFFTTKGTTDDPSVLAKFKSDDLYAFQIREQFSKQNFAAALYRISQLKGLHILEIGNSTFGDEHVHFINDLPALQSLNLNNTVLSGEGVKQISNLHKLTNLYYNVNNSTRELIAALSGSEALEVLHISAIDRLIDKNDLKLLMKCPNLRSLRAETVPLDVGTIEALAAMPRMTSLSVASAGVTPAQKKQIETKYKSKGLHINLLDPATSSALELHHRETESGWYPGDF